MPILTLSLPKFKLEFSFSEMSFRELALVANRANRIHMARVNNVFTGGLLLALLGAACAGPATSTLDVIPGLSMELMVNASTSHYGDPATGCEADEVSIRINGIAGDAW